MNIENYKYQLDKSAQETFEVLAGRLIKDISEDELFPIIHTAISYGYANAGYKAPEPAEISFQIKEVVLELKRSFGTLRQDEPLIAIRRGVLREYGEFMGLSVATFIHFIRQYSMNNARLDALKEFNKPPVEEKKEPTPEEIRERFISRLTELFSLFKQRKHISMHEAAFYFTHLWRERFITFTDEIRAELKKQALKEVLGEIDFTKAKDINESKKMRAHYDNIIQNMETDEKVTARAKYLGLIKWFEMLQETDQEITDIL